MSLHMHLDIQTYRQVERGASHLARRTSTAAQSGIVPHYFLPFCFFAVGFLPPPPAAC